MVDEGQSGFVSPLAPVVSNQRFPLRDAIADQLASQAAFLADAARLNSGGAAHISA